MQRGEWTFDGCGEVTVNIFSMHATEMVVGKKLVNQSWPRDRISEFKKFFSSQPNYQKWKGKCFFIFQKERLLYDLSFI